MVIDLKLYIGEKYVYHCMLVQKYVSAVSSYVMQVVVCEYGRIKPPLKAGVIGNRSCLKPTKVLDRSYFMESRSSSDSLPRC